MGVVDWLKDKLKGKKEYLSSRGYRSEINWTQAQFINNVRLGDTNASAEEDKHEYEIGITSEDKEIPFRRKDIKPAKVVGNLFENNLRIDLDNLDKKINMLNQRAKELKKHGISSEEADKCLIWLRARKNVVSNPELKDKFEWEVTTDRKIQQLLDNYKLSIDSIENYEEYIPNEALQEMDKYIKLFDKVAPGYKPRIQIIVPASVKKDKDPIIIAESPFGNHYFVLGAWDEEVKIMHELWDGLY